VADPQAEEPPTEVWLSNMLFFGEFDTIAELQFPPGVYPCALVFGQDSRWLEQTYRLLRADAFVLWANGGSTLQFYSKPFDALRWPIIWNILGRNPDYKWPFAPAMFFITVLTKGNPISINPSTTSIISANEDGSPWPPFATIEFLLKATSRVGDSILMPTGGPVDTVLKLGRLPICFETEETRHRTSVEAARSYYNEKLRGRVVFK
jgi:hypothetical protein